LKEGRIGTIFLLNLYENPLDTLKKSRETYGGGKWVQIFVKY